MRLKLVECVKNQFSLDIIESKSVYSQNQRWFDWPNKRKKKQTKKEPKMSSNENVLVFAPNEEISKNAYVSSFQQYQELYKKSIKDPQSFWGDIAKQFHWETEANPKDFFSYNFDIRKGSIFTKWMAGASTNLSFNLLDRNVKNGLADHIAYYWWVNRTTATITNQNIGLSVAYYVQDNWDSWPWKHWTSSFISIQITRV